jgi:hypothetical protein
MKTKYQVIVSGEAMQDFLSLESAIDYAARHVYLPWKASLQGISLLLEGRVFRYGYGFKDVEICPVFVVE